MLLTMYESISPDDPDLGYIEYAEGNFGGVMFNQLQGAQITEQKVHLDGFNQVAVAFTNFTAGPCYAHASGFLQANGIAVGSRDRVKLRV